MLVRAYAYIRTHGGSGLCEVTDDAVLAANYLKRRLADSGAYDIPFGGVCKHEFIASASTIKRETGVRTLDVAKRLLDHGFHAPTVYFPLTIDEGIAILTHHPDFLQKNNCFSLLASRCGDQRVPAMWISGGAPRLGWCWAGNPHTWLGSASCRSRIGPT